PTAAVEEHQAWRKAIGLSQLVWRVDAPRNQPVRGRDRERYDRFQFRRFGTTDEAGLPIILARLFGRERLVRRPACFLKGLEDESGVGIECVSLCLVRSPPSRSGRGSQS